AFLVREKWGVSMIGRAPITRSASPARIGAVSLGMSSARYWLSASVLTMTSAPARNAASIPAANARARPWLCPRRTMWSTPAAWATATVSSVLPSSMIIHSTRAKPGTTRGRLASVMPSVAASLKQGIWMIRVGPDIAGSPRTGARRRALPVRPDHLEQTGLGGEVALERQRPQPGRRAAVDQPLIHGPSRLAGHGEQRPFGLARAQQDPVDAVACEFSARRRLVGGGQDAPGRGEPGLGPVIGDRQHAVRGAVQELGAVIGIGEQRAWLRSDPIEHGGQPIERAGPPRALDLPLGQGRGEQQRPEQGRQDDKGPDDDARPPERARQALGRRDDRGR